MIGLPGTFSWGGRRSIVLRTQIELPLGSGYFSITRSTSVARRKQLQPRRRSSLSFSHCSPLCTGCRPIIGSFCPSLCIFMMMAHFKVILLVNVESCAVKTRVHGGNTRALCKGLEVFTVRYFDGALHAIQFKHGKYYWDGGSI